MRHGVELSWMAGNEVYLYVCFIVSPIDAQYTSFDDREPSDRSCSSGRTLRGYSRRNRASLRCLLCFLFCQSRNCSERSIFARFASNAMSSNDRPTRHGRWLMRRPSRGAGCRVWWQNAKKTAWHPEFEAKNRDPDKSAPVAPCECRAEHGAPSCRILPRTWPSSHFACAGVKPRFITRHPRTPDAGHLSFAVTLFRAEANSDKTNHGLLIGPLLERSDFAVHRVPLIFAWK